MGPAGADEIGHPIAGGIMAVLFLAVSLTVLDLAY